MKKYLFPLIAIVLTLTMVACGGGDGGAASPVAPTQTPEAPEAPDQETEGPEEPGTMLEISTGPNAIQNGYTPSTLTAPADTPFTIHYTNDDPGIPHNIQIFAGPEPSGKILWAPKDDALITGPAETTYNIPPLKAGTYAFNCFAHPTMVGTLNVV